MIRSVIIHGKNTMIVMYAFLILLHQEAHAQFVLLLHWQNPVGSLGKGRWDLGDKMESNPSFGLSLVSLVLGLCATEVCTQPIRLECLVHKLPFLTPGFGELGVAALCKKDTSSQDGKAGSG